MPPVAVTWSRASNCALLQGWDLFPLRDHASQPGRLPDESNSLRATTAPTGHDWTRDSSRWLRRATAEQRGWRPHRPARVAVGEPLPHARRPCRTGARASCRRCRGSVIGCLGTAAGARARPARRRTSAAGGRAGCRAARTANAVMPLLRAPVGAPRAPASPRPAQTSSAVCRSDLRGCDRRCAESHPTACEIAQRPAVGRRHVTGTDGIAASGRRRRPWLVPCQSALAGRSFGRAQGG